MTTEKTIEIVLPSIQKIKHELEELVKTNVKNNLKDILDNISKDYNIPQIDLYSKYLKNIEYNNKKNIIPPEKRCTYICTTGKKEQCTREKKTDLYCKSHASIEC